MKKILVCLLAVITMLVIALSGCVNRNLHTSSSKVINKVIDTLEVAIIESLYTDKLPLEINVQGENIKVVNVFVSEENTHKQDVSYLSKIYLLIEFEKDASEQDMLKMLKDDVEIYLEWSYSERIYEKYSDFNTAGVIEFNQIFERDNTGSDVEYFKLHGNKALLCGEMQYNGVASVANGTVNLYVTDANNEDNNGAKHMLIKSDMIKSESEINSLITP